MAEIQLQIDFDKLREIAALGVRRASVFMGIGTNAARIDPPISHVLDDKAQFVVVPPNVSTKTSKEFVDEFVSWTIANGFRELVETFSLFLRATYSIQFLYAHDPVLREEYDTAVDRFDRDGVEKKLEKLTELLPLDGRFSPMFASLNQARNCMAHRQGVVGLADVQDPDQPFVLRWRTRALLYEDGRDISLLLREGEAAYVKEGQALSFAEVDRTMSFALGEPIRLSRHDLTEICFGVTMATEYVRTCLINFGRARGHTINEKDIEGRLIKSDSDGSPA